MLYPNPSKGIFNIALGTIEPSAIDVYDVTGKILKQINRDFAAGINTITLDKAQLGQSGVLYYQLEAGEFNATRKMVVIE